LNSSSEEEILIEEKERHQISDGGLKPLTKGRFSGTNGFPKFL
jgi:hypothetical protein